MRTWIKALVLVGATFVLSAQRAPERIEYTLTPVLEAGALQAVQIDLRFRGEADGQTALRLPNSWGGRDELWRAIREVEAVSGATIADGEGPAQRVLTHRPNARVHVRYRIVQDYEGPPSAREGNAYRAVVQPGYFHLIGEAAMVTPDGADNATPVRLRVRNLPRGWAFASDLEHAGLTLEKVWASVSVGGDFRIARGADPNIRVAIRGSAWSFSDASFIAKVNDIVTRQREFWGDASTPFLVTVIETAQPSQGWLSLGGTGLGDAFAFFATNNAQEASIARTLAHESLHTWIPLAIGGFPDEGQAAQFWLSEGFTDFYMGRLLVRHGLWTPQDFAADFNNTLRAYAISSAREAPNARIVEDFWRNQEVQQLPYQRGRLLATMWDQRLRARGSSMDVLIRDARTRAAQSEATAEQVFSALATEHVSGFAADYAAYVIEGRAVLLAEDVLAPCGRVVTAQMRRFHRGFDIDATSANNNIITGVDPALPAYAAGLRDGMQMLARDAGEIGNAEVEIVYRVRDGAEERTIRYMPRGHGMVTVQRLELAQPLEGEALTQCVAVLGGPR